MAAELGAGAVLHFMAGSVPIIGAGTGLANTPAWPSVRRAALILLLCAVGPEINRPAWLRPMKIDTSNKRHTLWLARVPKYLAKQILSSSDVLTVGTLSLERDAAGQNMRLNIALSEALASTGIPMDHKIDVKDKEQSMFVLRNAEYELVVEGQISKECFIKPVINEHYLVYKQKQRLSNTDTVKIIDYFMEVRKGEKYGSLKEMDLLARKRKVMLQEKKRERLDSQDVYDMIFNAYERRPLWTVKDLADFTGQPTAYIQELIADICVLNKKDHRHAYELKPEYKNN